eukprot:COSAG06_NODE_2721_length_6387_cov_3.702449_6_plen_107_part_00
MQGDDVYSSLAFQNAGLDVKGLANSALVEYCNNANNWGVLLGMIDAQRVLANDSWSGPGSWIDADMVCVKSPLKAELSKCYVQYSFQDRLVLLYYSYVKRTGADRS